MLALLREMGYLNPDHALIPTQRMLDHNEIGAHSVGLFYGCALKFLSALPKSTVATVSGKFFTAVKQNSLQLLIYTISRGFGLQSTLAEGIAGSDNETLDDPQYRTLDGCAEAFEYNPYDEHALEAFEEYLDVQWLEMCRLFDPLRDKLEGSRLSCCSSIVQSSCTGKSRLIQE